METKTEKSFTEKLKETCRETMWAVVIVIALVALLIVRYWYVVLLALAGWYLFEMFKKREVEK